MHNWLYLELEKCEKNPSDEKCSDRSSSKLSGLPTEIRPITENTFFGWKAHHWIRLGEEHDVTLNPKGPLFAPRLALISSVIPRWLSEVCSPWGFKGSQQKQIPRGEAGGRSALSLNLSFPLFSRHGSLPFTLNSAAPPQLTALVWIWLMRRWVSPWRDAQLGC